MDEISPPFYRILSLGLSSTEMDYNPPFQPFSLGTIRNSVEMYVCIEDKWGKNLLKIAIHQLWNVEVSRPGLWEQNYGENRVNSKLF